MLHSKNKIRNFHSIRSNACCIYGAPKECRLTLTLVTTTRTKWSFVVGTDTSYPKGQTQQHDDAIRVRWLQHPWKQRIGLLLSVMVDGDVHVVSSLLAHFLHLLVEYFHSVEIYFCLSLLSMQHCPLSCFGQLFAHRSAHRSDEGRDVWPLWCDACQGLLM